MNVKRENTCDNGEEKENRSLVTCPLGNIAFTSLETLYIPYFPFVITCTINLLVNECR